MGGILSEKAKQVLQDSIDHFKDYDDETGVIPEFVEAWKKILEELK